MRIKSFIASTVQAALASVKREMGDSSIILETRNIEEGDIKSKEGQNLVEIIAAENVFGRDANQKSDQNTNQNPGRKVQSDNENDNSNPQSPDRHLQELTMDGNGWKDRHGRRMDSDILTDYLLSEDLVEMAGYRLDEKSAPLVRHQNNDSKDGWTEISKELYKQLRIQQVEKEHSLILVNESLAKQSGDDCEKIDVQRLMIRESIMNKIKIPVPDSNSREQCKTMAFIGAAGTGKTTTILKLASDIKERSDKDVLLISIRGDFAGKLNKMSGLIEATALTAVTPQELREIIVEYGSDSHIFIDTPGVNHLDEDALLRLKKYLDEIPDLETHLVVSAATRYIDIINIVRKFNVFPVHRLLFTKVDETDLYGTLFSVAEETQVPLSYITDGQEIPEYIRPATAEMVADMILKI